MVLTRSLFVYLFQVTFLVAKCQALPSTSEMAYVELMLCYCVMLMLCYCVNVNAKSILYMYGTSKFQGYVLETRFMLS